MNAAFVAYLFESPGVNNKSYIARQLGMSITTVHKSYDCCTINKPLYTPDSIHGT